MKHENATNEAEAEARHLLENLFNQVFDKAIVLTNLIFPTGPGSAVKSSEVDALVVCNAGIFIFEVKGWRNCKVVRDKNEDGSAAWSLECQKGFRRVVRDPLQQLGGKLKVILPTVQDALLEHIADHTRELSNTITALSAPQLGQQISQGVEQVVSMIKSPNIRTRSYVLLPMRGVELGMRVPATVLSRDELPFLVRQMVNEYRRAGDRHVAFTDAMVERVGHALLQAGTTITQHQHLQNVDSVHGGVSEETLAAAL